MIGRKQDQGRLRFPLSFNTRNCGNGTWTNGQFSYVVDPDAAVSLDRHSRISFQAVGITLFALAN